MSKVELPPPPWSRTPASGALLRRLHEVGVHRHRREAVGGGGGYCCANWSWAAVTLARSGATVDISTLCPLCSRAMRRPVATADICLAAASTCACHACDQAKRNQAPAALGAPTPL